MTIGCFLPRTYFGNTGPRRSGRKGGRAACRPSQRQAAPTAAQDVRAAGEACPGPRGPVCHMAARLDAQLGARLVEPRLDVAHADALLEHRAEAAARHDAHLLLAVEDCAALARRRALGDDEAGPLARGCPEKRGEGGGGGERSSGGRVAGASRLLVRWEPRLGAPDLLVISLKMRSEPTKPAGAQVGSPHLRAGPRPAAAAAASLQAAEAALWGA